MNDFMIMLKHSLINLDVFVLIFIDRANINISTFLSITGMYSGEAAPEGGGGATSVRHVLSISGPGSPTSFGRDLGFSRGDVQEYRGGTRGFSKADYGTGGGATGGKDLSAGGSIEGP